MENLLFLGIPILKHIRVFVNMHVYTSMFFPPFLQWGTIFVTSCLLHWNKEPFQKESILKGKNLLLKVQILSLSVRLHSEGKAK